MIIAIVEISGPKTSLYLKAIYILSEFQNHEAKFLHLHICNLGQNCFLISLRPYI